MSFLPLTGWVPDADETASGVIIDCANLIPSMRGMIGAPSAITSGVDALAAAALGAATVVKLDGSTRTFAGTTTKLYEGSSSSWTDRTRSSGGNYSASSDARWRFAQFGDTSIAIQKADRPQFSNSGAFADIVTGGTKYAPKASLVETCQGFVMLADCDDTSSGLGTSYGNQPNRWWCSAQYDYADWTPATATQCATGLLASSPGKITGLKRLGSNIVVYKDSSIYLGSTTNGADVWRFDLIPGEAGTASNECIVDIGDAHLFIGKSDFYIFDGSRPAPIGDGVREWFFAQLNASYAYKIVSLHDKPSGNVWWFFPRGSSSVINTGIVYNYRAKKWGRCDLTIETAVQYAVGGMAYSGLSGYTYATLPAVSYDSPFWGGGGGTTMGVFNTSHALQYLTGVAGSSSLTTSDVGNDAQFSTVRRVRPRYLRAPSAATLVPSYRDLSGTLRTALPVVSQAVGRFDYLKSARWHRWALSFTGPVELTGLDVDVVADGTS